MALRDEEIRFLAATLNRLSKMPPDQAMRCADYVTQRAKERYLASLSGGPKITEAREPSPELPLE